MDTGTIVLIFTLISVVSGAAYFYFAIFKKLLKEFKEFVNVTFEALKDRKLTVVEKEAMMKEWSDLHPLTKQIKENFSEDFEEVKELYLQIKESIKKKK